MRETLNHFINKTNKVTAFFVFECLALTALALGGINVIFYYLGFIVLLTMIPFFIYCKKEEVKQLVYFSIPLVIVAALVSFGQLYSSTSFLFSNIGLFLATLSFFLLGFLSRRSKEIKIDYLLISIGAGLAILVIISTVATWINYGMFYSLIYKDTPIYFYNGFPYYITDEMQWLMGLSVTEMSLNYTGTFGLLLVPCLMALLFVSPKKERNKFVVLAILGTVGLLSLVTAPNIEALIYILPLLLFAILYRFVKWPLLKKILFWTFIVLCSLGALAFLIVILNAKGVISNFIVSSAFLNRIFNTNRVIAPINELLSYALKTDNLFGIQSTNLNPLLVETHSFEFEILKEGGIFAFVALLTLLVFAFLLVLKYLDKSKDSQDAKMLFVGVLLVFFLFSSFSFDSFPYAHETTTYVSFYRELPTLLVVFILGYIFVPIFAKQDLLPGYLDDEFMAKYLIVEKQESKEIMSDEYDFVENDDDKNEHDTEVNNNE